MAAAESSGLRRGAGAGAGARRKAKEAAVGAAARALFYPTLLYNMVRSKVQAEFRWWDEVDQFILLGAVPFRRDVPRLQNLGVHSVVTLNEPFETLVPSSVYKSRGIDHLVIPTRDYMFAPSLMDISQAVDFIHRNASRGRMTYIHCKAGRGRSTTIVLCYLVKYKNMTPTTAFEHVRSKRARVLLTRSQRKNSVRRSLEQQQQHHHLHQGTRYRKLKMALACQALSGRMPARLLTSHTIRANDEEDAVMPASFPDEIWRRLALACRPAGTLAPYRTGPDLKWFVDVEPMQSIALPEKSS